MAGVELHRKVIQNTLCGGADQGHLDVIHLSRSHDIADRTEFLLGRTREHPAEGMFRTMRIAARAAEAAGMQAVAGIPCSTFHAPAIFAHFLRLMDEGGVAMQVVHMIEETAALIPQLAPAARTVGVMSTAGTRAARVYNGVLGPRGYRIVEVPEAMAAELHDSIYNVEWGVKAVSPVTARARANFERYVRVLHEGGAEAVVLGCTEIPLALPESELDGLPLVDPMLALARALIREADATRLRPLTDVVRP